MTVYKHLSKIAPLAFVVLIGLQACLTDKGEVPTVEPDPTLCDSLAVTYTNDIVPIVTNHCAIGGCHDNFAAPTTGNFTNYTELAERANNGKLKTEVFDLGRMPLDPGPPLSVEQKQALQCWMDDGAPNN